MKQKRKKKKKRKEKKRKEKKRKEKKRKEKRKAKRKSKKENYQENSGLCVKRKMPTSWRCRQENKFFPRKALQKFMTTLPLFKSSLFIIYHCFEVVKIIFQ